MAADIKRQRTVLWRFSTKRRGHGTPCPLQEISLSAIPAPTLSFPFFFMSSPRKRESIFLSPKYNNWQIHLIFFTKKAGFPRTFIEL